mgnify:CR=1 FL=1
MDEDLPKEYVQGSKGRIIAGICGTFLETAREWREEPHGTSKEEKNKHWKISGKRLMFQDMSFCGAIFLGFAV